MKCIALALGIVAASIGSAGVAAADETPTAKPGEHWTAPVIIRSPPMRPLAVTELARVLPTVRLTKLQKPLVDRIEAAALREPF